MGSGKVVDAKAIILSTNESLNYWKMEETSVHFTT
jgi:hypothetical protein